MAQLKGVPSETEFARLSKLCEIPVLQLLRRAEDVSEVDLASLMVSNSTNKYSATDIKQAADLINKCLMWVPEDRVTASQAMQHPFFT